MGAIPMDYQSDDIYGVLNSAIVFYEDKEHYVAIHRLFGNRW